MSVSGRAVAVATQVARDTPPSACQHFQYLDQPSAYEHGNWCSCVLTCIVLTGQDAQLTRHSGLRDPRVRSPAASSAGPGTGLAKMGSKYLYSAHFYRSKGVLPFKYTSNVYESLIWGRHWGKRWSRHLGSCTLQTHKQARM